MIPSATLYIGYSAPQQQISMGKPFYLTGIAIANSMVGTSLIIFPLNFLKFGPLINIIFIFIMGPMLAITCKLLADNIMPKELDIAQSIKRKCGPVLFTVFALTSSFTVFLVSSVFFLLASDILWDFFDDLFGPLTDHEHLFKILLLIVFAAMAFLKNLNLVFKASPFAFGGLVISTIVLMASVPFNTKNINVGFWSFRVSGFLDILTVASLNAFGFMCHPTVSPMIKENQPQKDNGKAVYFGYGLAMLMYLLVGTLGGMAIYGKDPAKSSNIIDYFEGSFQAPLIGMLTFLYLFMISPIFPYVCKIQATDLIPEPRRKKIRHLGLKSSIAYVAVWVPMNILFILLDTSPVKVIAFISAVMAFYIMYFLPIYMTIRLGNYYLGPANDYEKSLLDDEEQTENTVKETEAENQEGAALEKSQFRLAPLPLMQKVLFGAMMLIATTLMISELISLF